MSKSILIVDDEELVREAYKAFLELENYFVHIAPNVSRAREILNSYAIDLVITDLKMPQEDGLDLIHYLNENFPHLMVVLITGNPQSQAAYDAFASGIVEYLIKPVDRKDFVETVSRLFQESSDSDKSVEGQEKDKLLDDLSKI